MPSISIGVSAPTFAGQAPSLALDIPIGVSSVTLTTAAPSLITSAPTGVLTIPISAIPTGATARVEYAVANAQPATVPAADSGLWTLAGFTDVDTDIVTTPLPAGATVFVRARSEQTGFRPSAWSTTKSVVVTASAMLTDLALVVGSDGRVKLTWTPNRFAVGLRIEYDVHTSQTQPLYPTGNTFDEAAKPGAGHSSGYSSGYGNDTAKTIFLPSVTLAQNQWVSVRVEPYDGWTGAAVSGLAGPHKYVVSGALLVAAAASGYSSGFDIGYGS
jgi:hypothetical protein